ncbi:hypothetical protein [Bradyrhizobium genosp. P]|uniref:hypothetical protein n=1 Tax=Bradyrhizobium genosp. P TaxID=83641 RepID=UPI003CF9D765
MLGLRLVVLDIAFDVVFSCLSERHTRSMRGRPSSGLPSAIEMRTMAAIGSPVTAGCS